MEIFLSLMDKAHALISIVEESWIKFLHGWNFPERSNNEEEPALKKALCVTG
jgi:hypothetical protein